MQYRSEIDGLRAVAVVPVILFHAGFPGFSGGFVGVDIFFVISGFLITSILIEEHKQQRYSLINFYERRARRILPALTVMTIVSTLAAVMLLPPESLKEYFQSVVAMAVFASNIFFYDASGYFSAAADEHLLLHTWSLAVEEQYYVFFPVMLAMLWKTSQKFLISFIALLSVMSFITAQILAELKWVDANFYLIFSRAWELFAGSLLAFAAPRFTSISPKVKEVGGGLGLFCLIVSIIAFDRTTPFPSVYTLLPVIGTCLIIACCSSVSLVGRLLSNKICVFIGLISYSLYLWHQPLFALLRVKTVGEPSLYAFSAAIFLTAIFAILSWKYVEAPFRDRKRFSRVHIFQYASGIIAGFCVIGVVGHVSQGFPQRYPGFENLYSAISHSPKRYECHTRGENYKKPEEACRYYGSDVTWAVFGDSHVVEPAYALAEALGEKPKHEKEEGIVQLSFSACSPALLYESPLPGCSAWIKESLNYLTSSPGISHVFLGFRHSYFLYGDQLKTFPEMPNTDPRGWSVVPDWEGDFEAIYWQSFAAIIDELLKAGKKVVVLYPIPELPTDIEKAITPFSIFHTTSNINLLQTTDKAYYLKRHETILSLLDSLPFSESLIAVKPADLFCDEHACSAVRDGLPLYFDDDHVSLHGAKLLIDAVLAELDR